MAQKAAKQLATRNTALLSRIHLISLAINTLFILYRLLLRSRSTTRTTYLLYTLTTLPALTIEFWLEKIGRPTYSATTGDLVRSGEDLEAKGLTEYLFDVLYWSWATVVAAGLLGNGAWWMWGVIPVYSAWLAWSTFGGLRQGMAGMAGQGQEGEDGSGAGGAQSKRQQKMEKRGGQKTQYR
ncbi:hypothetical protein MMC25_006495 [Agyrium rufum]|nr:hypothetical protein [Agyrium rufum]